MLEVKTVSGPSDLLLAASIVRLFAASRPIPSTPDKLVIGRFEGEQATCSFLAELFEQMAEDNQPLIRRMFADMG